MSLYSYYVVDKILVFLESGCKKLTDHLQKIGLFEVSIHDLFLASDSGPIPLITLLDLSTALNTLNNNILLQR